MANEITVEVTGGLGNQLFCLAVGLQAARKLNCELVLDKSQYNSNNPRRFLLSDLDIEFAVTGNSRVSRNLLSRIGLGKTGLEFREKNFAYDPDVKKVVPGTRLVGYFQSPKYFEDVTEELKASLLSHRAKLGISPELDTLSSSKQMAMHVRRGDYLEKATKGFHGLAAPNYFLNAANLLTHIHKEVEFTLFSDSKKVMSEFPDSPFEFRAPLKSNGDSEWADMFSMSLFDGIVMSNSTYSWWSAFLLSNTDDFCVVAPRPWFASGESGRDLLLPKWLTLDSAG